MSTSEFWSGFVLLVGAVGVLCSLASRWRARTAEWRQRLSALREAELVFVERQFRSRGRWPIVATVDRAYRLPDGVLVLMELKTRASGAVTMSDIVQLSAQRVAMEVALGVPVSDMAFVLVAGRADVAPIARRVRLLPKEAVENIAARRQRLLLGVDSPLWPRTDRTCRGCALRAECRTAGPGLAGGRRRSGRTRSRRP